MRRHMVARGIKNLLYARKKIDIFHTTLKVGGEWAGNAFRRHHFSIHVLTRQLHISTRKLIERNAPCKQAIERFFTTSKRLVTIVDKVMRHITACLQRCALPRTIFPDDLECMMRRCVLGKSDLHFLGLVVQCWRGQI